MVFNPKSGIFCKFSFYIFIFLRSWQEACRGGHGYARRCRPRGAQEEGRVQIIIFSKVFMIFAKFVTNFARNGLILEIFIKIVKKITGSSCPASPSSSWRRPRPARVARASTPSPRYILFFSSKFWWIIEIWRKNCNIRMSFWFFLKKGTDGVQGQACVQEGDGSPRQSYQGGHRSGQVNALILCINLFKLLTI